MKILAIESSCDETAAAVIEDGVNIIANTIATSLELHATTGGIIPEFAAREQIKSIIPVINETVKASKITPNDIDAIAVTVGPGLVGSLLVGIETAKTLATIWNKPIISVNHLVAHIYANWLNQKSLPEFPLLALVVSGGHTDLVLLKGHGDIQHIGSTRDDAAGEAFDKSARLLGLPYPGGPAIANESSVFLSNNPGYELKLFPRPMVYEDNFDFSFSGLKTAIIHVVKGQQIDSGLRQKYAAEIQEAVVDTLVSKTIRAIKTYQPKSLLLAGGVSANSRLREKMQKTIDNEKLSVQTFFPNPKLSTDNAAYIGSCAFFNQKYTDIKNVNALPNLTITSEI